MNITPVYFSWTPVDANQYVAYTSADGQGYVFDRLVQLRFTITFNGQTPDPDTIVQVNGWDSTLNFGNTYWCGSGRGIIQGPMSYVNLINSNNDRVDITFNSMINHNSQLPNRTITGQIEYIITPAAQQNFLAKVANGTIPVIN